MSTIAQQEVTAPANVTAGNFVWHELRTTDAKAADIDIHFRGLFLSNNFLHPAGHLHGVQALAAFHLCYATTLAEGNRSPIATHTRGIHSHNQRSIGFGGFLTSPNN